MSYNLESSRIKNLSQRHLLPENEDVAVNEILDWIGQGRRPFSESLSNITQRAFNLSNRYLPRIVLLAYIQVYDLVRKKV